MDLLRMEAPSIVPLPIKYYHLIIVLLLQVELGGPLVEMLNESM